ncbi:MAG: type I-F CRISPR-associated protein Csy1 [Neisseria sp.]|nr:type I-F CRISPR-associated protein Csy1 [Neisseria sp.]
MEHINTADIQAAIRDFLKNRFDNKAQAVLKKLQAAESEGHSNDIEAAQQAINDLQHEHSLEVWVQDAALRMSKQLKFGTHIAKGIHPDSKGDNISFQAASARPPYVVGSHTLTTLPLDANGNAAALPLAAFFDLPIGSDNIPLRTLIAANHSALKTCFSADPERSDQYLQHFQAALRTDTDQAVTDERNKQILWPCSEQAIAEDAYTCLVPLHPSALVHEFYQRINALRYSEENKQARQNRSKKEVEQQPYLSITQLAVMQLGGSKPQNISRLTSAQRGKQYLLSSLPPKATQSRSFSLPKNAVSFFNASLRYYCRFAWRELKAVVDAPKSIMEVRDQRKEALSMILDEVFLLAQSLQNTWPAGWSRDYEHLSDAEKLWLDPRRELLEDEAAFLAAREAEDWCDEVIRAFAAWLNDWLKKDFPHIADDFAAPEFNEWYRLMKKQLHRDERLSERSMA